MIALFIDTATDCGVVGLLRKGVVVASKQFSAAFTNSALLLPTVDALFQEAKMKPQKLQYIGVGIGPGSYTGIRVAAAFAKGMSIGLEIPLVGISSLQGLVPDFANGKFASVIDARISGVYCFFGEVVGHVVTFTAGPLVFSLEDAKSEVSQVDAIITPNRKLLIERLPSLASIIIEKTPSIEMFAQLSYEAFQKGSYSTNGDLSLLYLRKTQAELEKERS